MLLFLLLTVATPGIWERPHLTLPARFDRIASIVSTPRGGRSLARQIAPVQIIDQCRPCMQAQCTVYRQHCKRPIPFRQRSPLLDQKFRVEDVDGARLHDKRSSTTSNDRIHRCSAPHAGATKKRSEMMRACKQKWISKDKEQKNLSATVRWPLGRYDICSSLPIHRKEAIDVDRRSNLEHRFSRSSGKMQCIGAPT
jgi:hypothetical protein